MLTHTVAISIKLIFYSTQYHFRVFAVLLAPHTAAMDFSLSGKLTVAFKYIEQAVEADGSNRASVLERQYQHLSSLIQRQGASLTIEDSTDSLKLLRSGQCPFNAEQSKGLRSLIDSAAAPGADGNGSADAFRKYTKRQEHIFVQCRHRFDHRRRRRHFA